MAEWTSLVLARHHLGEGRGGLLVPERCLDLLDRCSIEHVSPSTYALTSRRHQGRRGSVKATLGTVTGITPSR